MLLPSPNTPTSLHIAAQHPAHCLTERYASSSAKKAHHHRGAPVNSTQDGGHLDHTVNVDSATTTMHDVHGVAETSVGAQQQHVTVNMVQPVAPPVIPQVQVNPLVTSSAWLWAAAILASVRIARRDLDAESYFERRQKVLWGDGGVWGDMDMMMCAWVHFTWCMSMICMHIFPCSSTHQHQHNTTPAHQHPYNHNTPPHLHPHPYTHLHTQLMLDGPVSVSRLLLEKRRSYEQLESSRQQLQSAERCVYDMLGVVYVRGSRVCMCVSLCV